MTAMPPPTRPTVAVDLDGVLAQYDYWRGLAHIGDPIPGAQDFVAGLLEWAEVLIYTTRTSDSVNAGDRPPHQSDFDFLVDLVKAVRVWLTRHEFPHFTYGLRVWSSHGKPVAVAYIDDRAVHCDPQKLGEYAYIAAAAQAKALAERIAVTHVQHASPPDPMPAATSGPVASVPARP